MVLNPMVKIEERLMNLEERVRQLERHFPAPIVKESIKTEYPNRVPTYKDDVP